ncbi:GNAT family acetyltransferase [Aestuariispira insulae]|uniref:Ribosomal protein S18 acetylase RimI-like enzyme n=1 Tax=Aestuariispira insulae TaxID=1461337 RepID=A0A3D9HNL1_9PROT|nr:GNAT family acetyltransferase [Aestuariispira insulae]RED50995.1 ribosomal protein S18 acetylase RimI-like enzyme [Aestuariispira insulae]
MPELSIRDFRDGDLDAVVGLWTDCGLVRPWNDPEEDIALALNTQSSRLIVGLLDDRIVGSVLCGLDGHRGWLYYFAVAPDCQGKGFSKPLLTEAEEWLASQGAPKVELMVRTSNNGILSYYHAAGYQHEDVAVLSKWLNDETETRKEESRDLPVTVTWLEMTAPPLRPAIPVPSIGIPLSLTRVQSPSLSFYRYLYNTVGEPWLWWERRAMPDEDLQRVIQSADTEIYLLSVGSNPAGFVELNAIRTLRTVEIAYFGLVPDFIGMGLGGYLLDWAIRTAWAHESRPERLEVNTCTLDHPAALATYQKAGFTPYRQEERQVPDPRLNGILPYDLPLPARDPRA